jgi:hypothetical protein
MRLHAWNHFCLMAMAPATASDRRIVFSPKIMFFSYKKPWNEKVSQQIVSHLFHRETNILSLIWHLNIIVVGCWALPIPFRSFTVHLCDGFLARTLNSQISEYVVIVMFEFSTKFILKNFPKTFVFVKSLIL